MTEATTFGGVEAVIFDIDGTLADNYARMDAITRKRAERLGVTIEDLRTQHLPWTAEDWQAFHAQVASDKPIAAVCSIVSSLVYTRHLEPLFVTGRMELCRNDTVEWLWGLAVGRGVRGWLHEDYVTDHLFMRPAGDHRPGAEMKEDILDNHILPRGYKPVLAFEDDPKISEMWRRRGILVAHVGGKLL